jgi:hypothetical protein
MISQIVRGGNRKVKGPQVELIQANGVPYAEKGRIVLVNREVTSTTGTIQLAAEFPNLPTPLHLLPPAFVTWRSAFVLNADDTEMAWPRGRILNGMTNQSRRRA